MFHFFVEPEQINEDNVYVTGADYNHMKNVIRLKPGDTVLVSSKAFKENSDISSGNFMCRIESYTESEAVLTVCEKNVESNELPCSVTLYQGLPKADKMELIIQKAVELGVHDIVPVAMKRCVVKLDDKKATNKLNRWNAISESAAKQSKRSIIPEVREMLSYKQALAEAVEYDLALVPYENEQGMKLTRKLIGQIVPGSRLAVLIGPEGGFDEDEIELARTMGMKTITLGKRILRTETAGMAVLAMLAYALED